MGIPGPQGPQASHGLPALTGGQGCQQPVPKAEDPKVSYLQALQAFRALKEEKGFGMPGLPEFGRVLQGMHGPPRACRRLPGVVTRSDRLPWAPGPLESQAQANLGHMALDLSPQGFRDLLGYLELVNRARTDSCTGFPGGKGGARPAVGCQDPCGLPGVGNQVSGPKGDRGCWGSLASGTKREKRTSRRSWTGGPQESQACLNPQSKWGPGLMVFLDPKKVAVGPQGPPGPRVSQGFQGFPGKRPGEVGPLA